MAPCTLTSRKNVRSLEPQVRVLLEGWTGWRSPELGDVSAQGPGRRGSRKGARGHAGALRPPGRRGRPRAGACSGHRGTGPWALLQAGAWLVGAPRPPRGVKKAALQKVLLGSGAELGAHAGEGAAGAPGTKGTRSPSSPSLPRPPQATWTDGADLVLTPQVKVPTPTPGKSWPD